MSIKKHVIGCSVISLTAAPALSQFELTSSYRSVEASYINQGSGPDIHDKDASDSIAYGTFTRSAIARPETFASIQSFVGEAGIIKGHAVAERQTTRQGDFFFEDADSSSTMTISFSILSPTPYTLELDAHATIYQHDYDFAFSIASASDTIVEFDGNAGWEFQGNDLWLNSSLSGILQPGDYTLDVFAQSTTEFIGSGFNGGYPIEYDFTFTAPGPSGLAVLALPAGLIGRRRRR